MKNDVVVSPLDFIPLAEETGLIHEIGIWVIMEACRMLKTFREKEEMDLILSVNVSSVQMRYPDFVRSVKTIIETEDVLPEQLHFEITESVFMDDFSRAAKMLKELKTLGIKIALDDFGTGYSSLSYLTQLPIDILKIDKSFLDVLRTDCENSPIIKNIIALAHGLNISVIAEGIEEDCQIKFLRENHCDAIQGYLIGRPMSADRAIDHLKSENKSQPL